MNNENDKNEILISSLEDSKNTDRYKENNLLIIKTLHDVIKKIENDDDCFIAISLKNRIIVMGNETVLDSYNAMITINKEFTTSIKIMMNQIQ